MLAKKKQIELNIDWFCYVNHYPIHVCSNGSLLPKNFSTVNRINETCNYVNKMKCMFNAKINNDFVQEIRDFDYLENLEVVSYVERILPKEMISKELTLSQNLFLWSFLEAAKRGFFSFWWDDEIGVFRLLSWPSGKLFTEWNAHFNRYSAPNKFHPSLFDQKDNLVKFIENDCFKEWPQQNTDMFRNMIQW